MNTLPQLVAMGLIACSSALASTTKNIAYEERLIWVIAINYAKDLSNTLDIKRFGANDEMIEERLKFFEILYFNELIECITPLSRIALLTDSIEYKSDDQGIASSTIGAIDSNNLAVWKILDEWNATAKMRVLESYITNSWSAPLPKCINAAIRAQSKVLSNVPQ